MLNLKLVCKLCRATQWQLLKALWVVQEEWAVWEEVLQVVVVVDLATCLEGQELKLSSELIQELLSILKIHNLPVRGKCVNRTPKC